MELYVTFSYFNYTVDTDFADCSIADFRYNGQKLFATWCMNNILFELIEIEVWHPFFPINAVNEVFTCINNLVIMEDT